MALAQSVQKLDLQLSRSGFGVVAALLVPAIGVANFFVGKDITLSVFYVLPIAIAAWYVGRTFALVLALLSVGFWIAADFAAGNGYANFFAFLWNGTIRLLLY